MKKYFFILSLWLLIGCGDNSKISTNSSLNSPGSSASAHLAWTSNLGEQQGFYIEQSTDGVNFTQVLSVPDGTNSATISLPIPGQKYYFRIRSYNQAGLSPYSTIQSS